MCCFMVFVGVLRGREVRVRVMEGLRLDFSVRFIRRVGPVASVVVAMALGCDAPVTPFGAGGWGGWESLGSVYCVSGQSCACNNVGL
jgi:hypothetical protein